jgi:hypothetical protein
MTCCISVSDSGTLSRGGRGRALEALSVFAALLILSSNRAIGLFRLNARKTEGGELSMADIRCVSTSSFATAGAAIAQHLPSA